MSWGFRITILYLGFVGLILTLVFTCFGHKIELETKDYYAKELKFQDQINADANARALSQPIDHEVKGRSVMLLIPAELRSADFKGEVLFFRPSDSSLDKNFKLEPNAEGIQVFEDPGFEKGVYKMRVSISSNNKSYYEEKVVYLN